MTQLIDFINNQPWLVAGTLAMGLAVLFYEIRLRTRGLMAISPAQLVRLINQGARVVDIRDKEQFDAGHIVDSINLPAADPAAGQAKKIKHSKTVVLVCDTGSKSGQCVEPWRAAGYESAFSLNGGLAAWRQDNLPIVAGN
jgi:rhodanese-related sulfurtransferase